ncbi:hypothetical protein G6F22_020292 [Rhizopus arrhizus]|nr:hypothetical protein G6F22_020292 [Rhizopus arrhizus]
MLGQQEGRDDLRADGPIQRVQGKLRQQLVGATDVGSRADQVVHRTGFFKQPLHLRFARHIHLMQAGRAKRPQRLARRIKFVAGSAHDQHLAMQAQQLCTDGQPHAGATADDHDALSRKTVTHAHLLENRARRNV